MNSKSSFKILVISILSSILTTISYSQVYLGMIQKEGIFISDTSVRSKADYNKLEKYFQKLTSTPGENYIMSNVDNEFSALSDLKIGEKFFVACWDNITSEEVAAYAIYNFNDISQEFYPMLSNKTNLCKFISGNYDNFNKNIVIIFSDEIKNKINYTPSVNVALMEIFKKRVFKDAKNFQVYTDDKLTKKGNITGVKDGDITFFKGNFTDRNTEQFFVSYLLQNSDSFINANYIMESDGEVVAFFTKPQTEFEYRQIEGICDYDNDGLDDIIIDVGYYEGGGYELWKYTGKKFVKAAEGFYFGL